jgi:hypothetical protein
VSSDRDHASANPADQATTAGERRQRREWTDTATAEEARSAEVAAVRSATRTADAAHGATVARLRTGYLADHPDATESDFERALPDLPVDPR